MAVYHSPREKYTSMDVCSDPRMSWKAGNKMILEMNGIDHPLIYYTCFSISGGNNYYQEVAARWKMYLFQSGNYSLFILKLGGEESAPEPSITQIQSNPPILPHCLSVDPQMCGPYVADICAYLCEMEGKRKQIPLHDYIEKVQSDLNSKMREVLIDWLVEVAEEYKLVSDTLYLTVSYVDRFLSVKPIKRQKLQLVGVSAMLIASKYEEIRPPKVKDFVSITNNTFTRQDVVTMEADIVLALQFELGCPTIKTFLRRFTRAAQEDFNESLLQTEFLCCYLSELSLLDYSCVKFLPSLLAASSVFLARFIIRPKQHPWNQMLEEYTKYKASDLQQAVGIIHDLSLSRGGNRLEAVSNKYKEHEYKCVATMPVSPELPLAFFEDVTIRGMA